MGGRREQSVPVGSATVADHPLQRILREIRERMNDSSAAWPPTEREIT